MRSVRPRQATLNKPEPIPTATIANVAPSEKSVTQVAREFRKLVASAYELRVDGSAKADPTSLLRGGYTPKYEVQLFGTRFFLANQRIADDLRVFPAYVLVPTEKGRRMPAIHARIFYKDSSLVWRVASHYIAVPGHEWIGKGAVKWIDKRGERGWYSAEETTNLPFELQSALDDISRRGPRHRRDHKLLTMVLRNAPTNRTWPYRDFEGPRASAMSVRVNRINNNRSVAWFRDDDDPGSLRFQPGFAPDFRAVIDISDSRSSMYGGDIRKYRFASRNRRIQYLFVAGPDHVWIVHPQAFTTELSTYGTRTVDVIADEDLCIPGYEFFDSTGSGEIDDQIPPGFAGGQCPSDPDRADASPWNERLPVIRAFRRAMSK